MPCKKLRPLIEKECAKRNVPIDHRNIDADPIEHQILSVPTIVVKRDNEDQMILTGPQVTMQKIVDAIEDQLVKDF